MILLHEDSVVLGIAIRSIPVATSLDHLAFVFRVKPHHDRVLVLHENGSCEITQLFSRPNVSDNCVMRAHRCEHIDRLSDCRILGSNDYFTPKARRNDTGIYSALSLLTNQQNRFCPFVQDERTTQKFETRPPTTTTTTITTTTPATSPTRRPSTPRPRPTTSRPTTRPPPVMPRSCRATEMRNISWPVTSPGKTSFQTCPNNPSRELHFQSSFVRFAQDVIPEAQSQSTSAS